MLKIICIRQSLIDVSGIICHMRYRFKSSFAIKAHFLYRQKCSAQVTELLCDLLFRQVGCTSSQPEISPGGCLQFLTVMHLNLCSQTLTITEHSSPPDLEVRRVERRQVTKGWKKKAWKRLQEGYPVSFCHCFKSEPMT